MQVAVSALNMTVTIFIVFMQVGVSVTIFIVFMQVGVSVATMQVVLSVVHNCFSCKIQVTVSVIAM